MLCIENAEENTPRLPGDVRGAPGASVKAGELLFLAFSCLLVNPAWTKAQYEAKISQQLLT